jgi:hypothetical protein
MGALLTHWTIRLALLCLVLRLASQLRYGAAPWWFAWSRGIWTLGCLLFVLHVVCAFRFYHHWSHADAFAVTARRTEEMLGMRFGEGIYFSYLFTLLWTGDVLWQWLAPQSYRQRGAWIVAALLGYMAFIAFNGAVIFEGGITRWVGMPVTAALVVGWLAVWLRSRRQSFQKPDAGPWSPVPDPPSAA